MMVDASALVAIVLDEPDAETLALRLQEAPIRLTHPVAIYQASMAVARARREAEAQSRRDVLLFLREAGVVIATLGEAEASAALDAFARYGKGHHPAKLNMGDCFSYAVAKVRGVPLLYKGDDFARTDLA